MNNKPHIILIIGPSASGKDTVKRYLLEVNMKLNNMIPVTTRPMRSNEKNNVDYKFISENEFNDMLNSGKLLEHRKYNVINTYGNEDTWYYGHEYPTNNINIMVATLEVYNNIKDNPNFILHPFLIYLKPTLRLQRMVDRESTLDNPNYKELARRFFSDEKDFSEHKLKEVGLLSNPICIKIENNDSRLTADLINKLIIKELRIG